MGGIFYELFGFIFPRTTSKSTRKDESPLKKKKVFVSAILGEKEGRMSVIVKSFLPDFKK
jgi:hypothetical protein